ncbi:kinase-like domain-containing protein [Geopyxis carbonaria]|nr:kinase-like domain-containing protein [Geopyxis carbonaria]
MYSSPQYDSSSTCSSSLASVSMPMTPESLPEPSVGIVPPLNPPLTGSYFDMERPVTEDVPHKPKFAIGPPELEEPHDGFECHTVLEVDEDTASELHEPVTPPNEAQDGVFINSSSEGFLPSHKPPPLIVATPATPPPKKTNPPSITNTPSITGTGRGKLRRHASEKLQSIIRRVNSATDESMMQNPPKSPPRSRSFFSKVTPTTSPTGSLSGSPTSPRSPSSTLESDPALIHRPSSMTEKGPKRPGIFSRKTRSNSVSGIKDITGSAITHPAVAGAGSKSRKMSTKVPDMVVPVIQLSSKYASHSHIPGKSKKCGEGVSAIVKVMHSISGPRGKLFAVKEFRKRGKTEGEHEYYEKLNSEYCISKSLHHPNIVITEDLCIGSGNRWCHVMEYCTGGDLFGLISKGFMRETEKLCCFKQLLRGVRLSNPGIVGSAPYISPEVQGKTGPYDARKLDVWSCAMIYLVIIFGGPLWYSTEANNNPHFERYVKYFREWEDIHPGSEMKKDGTFPRHPVFLNLKPSAMKLAYRMLHLDPAKRITIKEALNDKWVQSIEICNVDAQAEMGDGKVDAGCKAACKQAGRAGVQRLHRHLPPKAGNTFGKDYDE